VALIDCEAITPAPVELVDKDLSEKRPDAVWCLPLRGRSFCLYLIFEHQSQDLRHMGLRLLDYARGFWMWWSEKHRRATFLPPIVGLVLSHDPRGWRSPTRLRDLCQTDPELEGVLGVKPPNVEFFLEDLQRRKDQDILAWEMDAVGKLTLLLLKHAKGSRPLRRKLKSWGHLFAEVRDQEPGALSRFVRYIMTVNTTVTAQQLNQDFTKMLGKEAGDVVMTEAERLMAEGKKQGVKQGVKRGLAPLVSQIQRRLGRDLANAEKATLSKRLTKLGPDRLGNVVLDLSAQELDAWLADPNAK
jgi:hypothetical protein